MEMYHERDNAPKTENSPELTFEEFVRLVADMRHQQRRYFALRRPDILALAKDLERKVDKAVARLTESQLSLF